MIRRPRGLPLAGTGCWHDKSLEYFNLYLLGAKRLPADCNRDRFNRYLTHFGRFEPIDISENSGARPVSNPLDRGGTQSPNAVVIWDRRLSGIQRTIYLDPKGELLADGKLRLIHLCGNIDVLLLSVDGRHHRDKECHGQSDAGEGASYGQGMWHVGVYYQSSPV